MPPPCEKYDNPLLNERESTHGDFDKTAALAQKLKTAIRVACESSGTVLSARQGESLDMICTKISRIVCGDPHNRDSWVDIEGYASLVSEDLLTDFQRNSEEFEKLNSAGRVG